ncbi:hypothetical protein [Shimia sp. R9_3]|uniref:hypothetical protein n=1 Tax=Shimia sp. R9_3 TaxID=2821113 RepID=UPI001ADC5300|nr:hypothetical protein [Shimia sp. R9_3]MBO9402266.1 hypothetical protein [Shimia sp. R9_3]
MPDLNPNQTSAKLLLTFANQRFGGEGPGEFGDQAAVLLVLSSDLYIKARSYALLNKFGFWVALILALLVVVWPALSTFASDLAFLKSAIVQTSVTALAALSFALYAHYKKRQVAAENLMRLLVTAAPKEADEVVARILSEIERMDQGFSFSQKVKSE